MPSITTTVSRCRVTGHAFQADKPSFHKAACVAETNYCAGSVIVISTLGSRLRLREGALGKLTHRPRPSTLPRLLSRCWRHIAPLFILRAAPQPFSLSLHKHSAFISRMQATQMQTRSLKASSARAAAVRPTQVIP